MTASCGVFDLCDSIAIRQRTPQIGNTGSEKSTRTGVRPCKLEIRGTNHWPRTIGREMQGRKYGQRVAGGGFGRRGATAHNRAGESTAMASPIQSASA